MIQKFKCVSSSSSSSFRWYRRHGADDALDLVIAVLSAGLYPNVCLHKDRRKVLTTEAKAALIHKSSVNFTKDAGVAFPCPLFVFGEKIRTRAVSCKNMTMVSPVHLLLFASRKVQQNHFLVSHKIIFSCAMFQF